MSHVTPMRRSRSAVVGALAALALVGAGVAPAAAVNVAQDRLVSANPADFTPHVMNGSVNAITQIGSKVIAAGTFTTVRQTLTGANLTRNRIFAFDADTGVIDASFDPNMGGAVNSLDTDGTFIYAGGSFASVGGNAAVKRVVKLTAAGVVVPGLKVPNGSVNEVVVRGSRLYVGGSFSSFAAPTVARARLAALDTGTGAVLADVNVAFSGVYDPAVGGSTTIKRFDVSADGRRLVAVGNFDTVGGQTRSQIAMLDLPATGAASVAGWGTDRYDAAHNDCASVFDTFMRDIDFSSDGSYFAVTTTGAFAGGASSGTLCDTTTRWESDAAGGDPTWVAYTGGDTTYGVAVTGTAVYVGGHMRWQNNSFQGDQAGPGAVPREGIAALDPANGLPLSWNPGRSRGVGAQALFATSQGLWVGSDTTRIGRETHNRIALMPLAGGKVVPTVAPATLPNTLFLAQRPGAGTTNVLYRINAAGPALQSGDNGPDWTSDANLANLVTGGNTADWGSTVPRDATVPAGTAPGIFATERWAEHDWDLPVAAGTDITVRLYFANQYDGTATVGSRVFDVLLDGSTVLNDFDIVAAAGDRTGTMRAFTVTSDGNVDIDLRGVVENPLINGIEVLDNDAVVTPGAGGVLLRRGVDGSAAPTGPATTANSALDWSLVRGAFLLNGTMYYGLNDGSLNARTFSSTTGAVGAARPVNLYDDPETGERIPFAISDLTGMFYEPTTHRIYYTVFGDSRLFYRYFTPESEIVGAQTFVADNGGVDLGVVRGMTYAGGRVLFGSATDGALRSVAFGPAGLSGAPTVTSNDGTWAYRAILVPNG